MLSRLIQLTRVLPADSSGPEEIVYLEMQYWAVSVSCLSVLAFFLWHLQQSPSHGSSKHLKYGSLLIVLYVVAYFLSFQLKTGGGVMAMTNMVYLLCHGVAAVILIKHILEKFPSCSSFGLYLKSKMGGASGVKWSCSFLW
uniref:Phosphatidate cytidylyltransferase family protein n=1 Tax=Arundo donax TaxID=35708 RepID=A0A0A9B0P0_ARUDO